MGWRVQAGDGPAFGTPFSGYQIPFDIVGGFLPKIVPNIFHNPHMPSMDDYYEPWTYDYQNLFNAPEGSDQPTAEPISMIDGRSCLYCSTEDLPFTAREETRPKALLMSVWTPRAKKAF